MKSFSDLSEICKNQDVLRKRLWDYYIENPTSRAKLANLIGISLPTLIRFSEQNKELESESIIKIYKFLQKADEKSAAKPNTKEKKTTGEGSDDGMD